MGFSHDDLEVQGIPGDYLLLEYAGRDQVYLPISRMRLIQKFTGGGLKPGLEPRAACWNRIPPERSRND